MKAMLATLLCRCATVRQAQTAGVPSVQVATDKKAFTLSRSDKPFLKDTSDLCWELNTRWLEITQRVFAIQGRLQTQLSEAAGRWSGAPSP
jgi:hypothetical protein